MSLLRVLHRRPIHCRALVTRRHASSASGDIQSSTDSNAPKKSTSTPSTPLSSCLPDTKLEGMNFLKGQVSVHALTDDKYPEWLWTILQPKVDTDGASGPKAQRAKRRAENKQKIKDRNFMSTQ